MPAQIIAKNKDFFAIFDINPKAQKHILIISNRHAENFHDYFSKNPENFKSFIEITNSLIEKYSLSESDAGYKIICNSGEKAGQSVNHFHAHLLSGKIGNWQV